MGMETKERLEPAKSVLDKIGVEVAADITGRDVSRVYRWMMSRARGGTNGRIPLIEAEKLLKYARENGIALDGNDFFPPMEGVS